MSINQLIRETIEQWSDLRHSRSQHRGATTANDIADLMRRIMAIIPEAAPARVNGGPAFPHMMTVGHKDYASGLMVRDWFAGQALHGLCASLVASDRWEEIDRHKVAKYAYGFADAMLRERDL